MKKHNNIICNTVPDFYSLPYLPVNENEPLLPIQHHNNHNKCNNHNNHSNHSSYTNTNTNINHDNNNNNINNNININSICDISRQNDNRIVLELIHNLELNHQHIMNNNNNNTPQLPTLPFPRMLYQC
jgi:hypothetical protein